MGIDHYAVVGSLLYGIEIVVDHPLVVVVVAFGDDVADVSRLYGRISVLVHESVCRLHVSFVVAYRTRRFVVHYHPDAFRSCVAFYFVNVEIGVGRNEVEYVILHVAEPVFPAYVPSFNQYGIESVCGSEVDVPLYVSRIGAVTAVGLNLGQVIRIEMHALQFVRIRPAAFAGDHLPPYAHVFARTDPRRILDFTGFVQVERNA